MIFDLFSKVLLLMAKISAMTRNLECAERHRSRLFMDIVGLEEKMKVIDLMDKIGTKKDTDVRVYRSYTEINMDIVY
jgi:hypothetical protein